MSGVESSGLFEDLAPCIYHPVFKHGSHGQRHIIRENSDQFYVLIRRHRILTGYVQWLNHRGDVVISICLSLSLVDAEVVFGAGTVNATLTILSGTISRRL
jgi:hypothetical protein